MSSQGDLPSYLYRGCRVTNTCLCVQVFKHPRRLTSFDLLGERYFHRTLNIPKLVDCNFTHIPRNSTLARMVKTNALPPTPSLISQGLREMEERDLDGVESLYKRYMTRFKMAPEFSKDEVRHNLLSGRGSGEIGSNGIPGRRHQQVVWTYVVEVSPSQQQGGLG